MPMYEPIEDLDREESKQITVSTVRASAVTILSIDVPTGTNFRLTKFGNICKQAGGWGYVHWCIVVDGQDLAHFSDITDVLGLLENPFTVSKLIRASFNLSIVAWNTDTTAYDAGVRVQGLYEKPVRQAL